MVAASISLTSAPIFPLEMLLVWGNLKVCVTVIDAGLATSEAQQSTAGASPRAAAHVPTQQQAEASQPHAVVEPAPSSSSQSHPQAQASPSEATAQPQCSSSLEVLPQQMLTDASHRQDSQPSSSSQQAPSSSSEPPQATPHQPPSSASAAPANPPVALSPQHPHTDPSSQPRRAESACHESPPSAPASSESKLQLRLDSGRSAHSHQKAQPKVQAEAGVSGRSQRPSPPQELLAGLGNALRAQAKMRQKASSATTPSSVPEDIRDSARGAAAGASPSGQLSFDHVGLKSKSTSGTVRDWVHNRLPWEIGSGMQVPKDALICRSHNRLLLHTQAFCRFTSEAPSVSALALKCGGLRVPSVVLCRPALWWRQLHSAS